MYHLELRQFPHVARAFNLERAELDERFLRPWANGATIEYDDRRWTPDKGRLVVLEGPEIAPEAMGMGRGWGQVTKTARDVTEQLVGEATRGAQARPELEALKDEIEALTTAAGGFGLGDVIRLVAGAHATWRASEQLALAEQAVWELLHQGRVTMAADGGTIARADWQEVVLSWESWAGDGAVRLGPGA